MWLLELVGGNIIFCRIVYRWTCLCQNQAQLRFCLTFTRHSRDMQLCSGKLRCSVRKGCLFSLCNVA